MRVLVIGYILVQYLKEHETSMEYVKNMISIKKEEEKNQTIVLNGNSFLIFEHGLQFDSVEKNLFSYTNSFSFLDKKS